MTQILELPKPNETTQKSKTPTSSQAAAKLKDNAMKTFDKDNCFSLKKWNLVAMWSWDVECEVCAICRTALMG